MRTKSSISILTTLTILILSVSSVCSIFADNTKTLPLENKESKQYQILVIYDEKCPVCHHWLDDTYQDLKDKLDKPANKQIYLKLMNWSIQENTSTIKQWYKENKLELITAFPTFILWSQEHEIGRVLGYMDKERFYAEINTLLEKNKLNKIS